MKKIFELFLGCFFVSVLSVPTVFALEIDASVDWADKRVVYFAVEGIVSVVAISQGDSFKKGQVLLSLDTTPFTQHENLLKAKVSGLVPLFDDAKREYDQAKTLFEQTVLSEVELQKTQVGYAIAKSNLAQAKSQYRIAQWELENASITAPWDGYVVESHVIPGRFVSKENSEIPLLILVRGDRLKAVGWVDEAIVNAVNKTRKASVVVDRKTYVAENIEIRQTMPGVSDKGNYRITVEFGSDNKLPLAVGRAAVIQLP